ncbi:MAG: OadG family protein [Ruminococcus sp.]|nr:OadG family protein [Ruminococcus sp.]
MDMMNKFTISASMLLTGFSIVFAVLIFLIFIIWLYGKIITTAQNKAIEKKNAKIKAEVNENKQKPKAVVKKAETPVKEESGLSDEIVAVISAAVYSMYGSTDKVKIKSIKKSGARSAWSNAGVLNNTRPF